MHPRRSKFPGGTGALAVLIALVTAVASGPGCAASAPGAGPQLRLSDLAGAPVDPLAASTKPAVCLLLVRIDCPISNRYVPEIRRLAEAFGAEGVPWTLVYASRDDTAEAIRAHRVDFSLEQPGLAALRDPEHRLVRFSGAQATPEAVVVDGDGRIAYVGRIDDTYTSFSTQRAEPTVRDLELAISAVLAGEAPVHRHRPAIGCAIT